MFPVPAEYQGIVALAIAFIVAGAAVWNFMRGLRSTPPPSSSVLTGVGMALGQDNPAIREVASAIREGHVSRGDLIHEIQGLARAMDNLASEVQDAARTIRHRRDGE